MEKVLVTYENNNYLLFRNVAEIRVADGDKPHFMEVRMIGDTEFIPVKGRSSELEGKHIETIN